MKGERRKGGGIRSGRANVRARAKRERATRRPEKPPEIRFFPNDPDASIGLVTATPMTPEGREPPFVIEGRRYAPAPYAPGTLAFEYWQGEVSLARTIRVWEDLLERDFTAWQSGKPLRVRLRAGRDLNAFYDRKSLQFFYDTDRKTGRTVYAAESLDVVAHEAGHAVLDVYQPGYWSTPDPETASFHEALADCSSLLVTLTDPAVRRAFLSETEGAPTRSNLVSRLAEALGRALHDNYGPGAVYDPTRLRDANNQFRYRPPERLPAGAPDAQLSAEPHSFSRVFTGAFYDLLVALLSRAVRTRPPDEALEASRRLAGRLLARTVETLPPGEARFRALAERMRAVGEEEEGGVASMGIEEAFAAHGVRLPPLPPPEGGRRGAGLVSRRGARRAGGALSAYRALRALDPDRPGGAAALRAALGLPPRARLRRRTIETERAGRLREQLSHTSFVQVRHRSLGRFSGLIVETVCGCTLTRERSGALEGASIATRRDATASEWAARIRPWIRQGAIAREPRATAREHFAAGEPFRVTADGLLERVYFD
jgi:Thermolysin metallopeptidase, catalytic domain